MNNCNVAALQTRMCSLAAGLPAAETFPVQALSLALGEIGPSALQYEWPEGRLELRKLDRGPPAMEEAVDRLSAARLDYRKRSRNARRAAA